MTADEKTIFPLPGLTVIPAVREIGSASCTRLLEVVILAPRVTAPPPLSVNGPAKFKAPLKIKASPSIMFKGPPVVVVTVDPKVNLAPVKLIPKAPVVATAL